MTKAITVLDLRSRDAETPAPDEVVSASLYLRAQSRASNLTNARRLLLDYLDKAERGGATVVRIEHIRGLLETS